MAMQILSAPASNALVHNDMIYVVDSTSKNVEGFQYILDIYVGATLVATMKNRPNPAYSNYGVFNVKTVLQNFITSDYFKPSATQQAVNPSFTYQVKVGETYGGTDYFDQVVDMTRFAWNGALPYMDFVVVQSYDQFLNKFITDRPSDPLALGDGEDHYVCAFGTGFDAVEIKFYPKKNLYGAVASTQTAAVSGNTMVNVGTSRFDPSGNLSYSVQLRSGGSAVGNILKFNVGACEMYEPVVLHFLNRLGGYETMHMRLMSKKSLRTERKRSSSIGYRVNDLGAVSYKDSLGVVYDTDRQYAGTYSHRLKVTSGALTDDQFEWLADLITSPQVFVERVVRGTRLYVPCIVSTDEYEFRKRLSDKVSTLQMDIEFSEPNAIQLR